MIDLAKKKSYHKNESFFPGEIVKNFDKNNPHEVFILRRKGLLKNQMKELCKV